MRVLLTTPYDLAVPGGVNRHVLDLLDALTKCGVEALLLGPASGAAFAGDPRIKRVGGVWVGALNGARSRVTLDLGLGPQVRRIMREFRPDVVHLQEPFLPTLNTFALLAAASARVRTVGTFHTYSEASRGYLWSWPWCAWVNRQLDERVAVSTAAREFATRYQAAPFRIIPNGVVVPSHPARRPARSPGRPARVLFVGRADEPRKGFAVLERAMALLDASLPGAFLLEACGRGTPGGEVPDERLAKAYARADVCVVPSTGGESFGLVALQALAHGVPVIASRIRGYADWLDGVGVGRLVPPGDPTALASAIRDFIADETAYAEALRRCGELASRYSWEMIVPELLSLYRGEANAGPVVPTGTGPGVAS